MELKENDLCIELCLSIEMVLNFYCEHRNIHRHRTPAD